MRSIEVGFTCNNHCVFCAPGNLRERLPQNPKLASELSEVAEGDRVAFVGGEPTLFDELSSWVRQAKEHGAASVVVQTNARRLAVQGYAKELAAAGVDALDVSMAGSTEAMHDYHTTVEGSFRQTVAGLRRARAAGIAFGITVVITRSNYRHLPEIAHVAHTLGARGLHLAAAEAVGSAALNAASVLPNRELVAPYLEAAIRRARQLGLSVVTGADTGAESARQWFAGRGRAEDDSAAGV